MDKLQAILKRRRGLRLPRYNSVLTREAKAMRKCSVMF